jgi:hypothetical protein
VGCVRDYDAAAEAAGCFDHDDAWTRTAPVLVLLIAAGLSLPGLG